MNACLTRRPPAQARHAWRRTLLLALAAAPALAWAAARPEPLRRDDHPNDRSNDRSTDRQGHPAAPAVGSPASAAASARPAAVSGQGLTVRVTAQGRPVAQADVRFKFASGADFAGRTDENGISRVSPPAEGVTKVRVVAEGWDLGKGEVTVKRGKPSELSIELTREAAAPR